MIDTFSKKITGMIKENVDGITPEKAEIIEYGIKIAIYEIIVIFIVFSLAMVLGVFKYFFVAFIIYGLFRIVEGGAHMNSRIMCFVTYTTIMFSIVIISKHIWIGNPVYSLPIFLISFFTAYRYAPGDTLEKPILRKKDKIRLKVLSLSLIALSFVVCCIVWYYDKVYFNILVLTTMFVTFLLSPIGYKLSGCKRSC